MLKHVQWLRGPVRAGSRRGRAARRVASAGLLLAMVLAAAPVQAAGMVVGGVSTVLGLLAALWAVIVARGSPFEANGATMWFVGGAVVGTAGWAGRRVVIERAHAWWRRMVGHLRDGPLVGWAERIVATSRSGASTTPRRMPATIPTRMPMPGDTASSEPLIRRTSATAWPAGLDRDQVLAAARRCFVDLQAAWDRNDIAALRELTTADMLDDVCALLDARGQAPNHTEVLTLRAELLCVEAIGSAWCASFEFSGFIQESADGAAVPFRELWMLAAPIDGDLQWRLARQQALL